MAYGSVTVKVRPLRLGFLVDPRDRLGLYKAIETCTYLWGGSYNPIIPAYLNTPKCWDRYGIRCSQSPEDIIEGYINGFDPDFIVAVGRCKKRSFDVGNRVILKIEDVLGDLNEFETPQFGIGLIDLIEDFLAKELKFKRQDNYKFVIPHFTRSYGLFLASIFGVIPNKAMEVIDENYTNIQGVSKQRVTIDQYLANIKSPDMFPRRLTSWTLQELIHNPQLFLCNPTETQDIIDYWNLRAAGYHVIPIATQIMKRVDTLEFAKDFINRNYRPHRHNKDYYFRTTIQLSRTLDQKLATDFADILDVSKNVAKNEHKFIISNSYPRLWDSWARENAYGEYIEFPYSHNVEYQIPQSDNKLNIKVQGPKFETFDMWFGNPKYANEFEFRMYGFEEPFAEVIPEGSSKLCSALGGIIYKDWRFSKSGPIYYVNYSAEPLYIEPPLAETIMKQWFEERGWTVKLSGPGRIAKQLYKHLGGHYGVQLLSFEGIIPLLRDLEDESGLPYSAINNKLRCIIMSNALLRDSDGLLNSLLRVNALKLGAKIQCPTCTRYNWYELTVLDYNLKCRYCLSEYSPPTNSPKDIKWTYRAHGPFAVSNAQGAFTVLFVLKLLSDRVLYGSTPIFSYKATKDDKEIEADLTFLAKSKSWRSTNTHIIHAECKSFNCFEQQDIERMKDLSKFFPGSFIVFASLKKELKKAEVELISNFVIEEREKQFNGQQNSPIIILTGTELFSHTLYDVARKWKKLGGEYERFSKKSIDLNDLFALADVTQQIYLKLPSIYDWIDARRKENDC